jgi:hypothetical protein
LVDQATAAVNDQDIGDCDFYYDMTNVRGYAFDPLATWLHVAETVVSMNANNEFDGVTFSKALHKVFLKLKAEGVVYRKEHSKFDRN